MKKKIVIFMTLIVLMINCVPLISLAEGESPYSDDFNMPPVIDDAGLLTEGELLDVSSALDAVREKYGIDVALYTEASMSGASAMETADDWYDYNYYGARDDKSGILLYISMNPREYWFTTHAGGEEMFNDAALDYLTDKVVPYLSDDEYYSAFAAYAEAAGDVIVQVNETGKPYAEKKNFVIIIGLAIVIGFIFAIILASVMTNQRKREMDTAVEQADADEYVKQDSLNLINSRDIFLYSNVVAIKKPDPDSSGGSHISSSGMSHGGSGGRF